MEMREKDRSDYDLDRMIQMFDEALTSQDPRVKNALRQLMMITVLTSNEAEDRYRITDRQEGPLRKLHNDLGNISRRVNELERRMLQNYPKETTVPKGYNLGGSGSTPHAQWTHESEQSIMQKLAIHALNQTSDKGLK